MNPFKNFIIAFFLSVSVVVTACGPVIYATTGQNVPLFQTKGEAMINAGFSGYTNTLEGVEGFSAQGAFAMDSSMAISASYYVLSDASEEWMARGSYADFGIGVFKHKSRSRFVGELFIGAGLGLIKNPSEEGSLNPDIKYFKPFLQPSGGFSTEYIEVVFTPRLGWLKFTAPESDYLPTRKEVFVFEPGITFRGGYRWFKFQAQVNYTTFTLNTGYESFTAYSLYGSVGMSFLISKRWFNE